MYFQQVNYVFLSIWSDYANITGQITMMYHVGKISWCFPTIFCISHRITHGSGWAYIYEPVHVGANPNKTCACRKSKCEFYPRIPCWVNVSSYSLMSFCLGTTDRIPHLIQSSPGRMLLKWTPWIKRLDFTLQITGRSNCITFHHLTVGSVCCVIQ